MLKITLRATRVNAGYTQSEVARMLHKTRKQLSIGKMGKWENGKTAIDYGNFKELCSIYKISKDNIFLGK